MATGIMLTAIVFAVLALVMLKLFKLEEAAH